jgi:glycosyltransferase involved in cell wall biosynthesis
MIILSVHNFYQQPGGEDEVFRQEAQLLERNGHQVIRCQAHNDEVTGKGSFELLAKTIYNMDAYKRVRSFIQKTRPDVMHVHNTFPLLSPAVYYAAGEESIPVVQTLHNYRLLCPPGILYRDDRVCEQCIGKSSPWPAVQHGCYRGSKAASAAAAGMLTIHRLLKTYSKAVTKYIALSDFAASKFIGAGIPKDKIIVKPNFVEPDPGRGSGSKEHCIFVGRLQPEKGISTLLDAWTRYSPPFDLEIAGDGELAPEVAAAAQRNARIHWHGRLQKAQLQDRMKNAAALIVPSTWYEPFGMVVVEAFAMGLPVIASNIGALTSMVAHKSTGMHFAPGSANDLVAQLDWFHDHPEAAEEMRNKARLEFEHRYTGERNYKLLLDVYQKAIREKNAASHGAKYESAEETPAIRTDESGDLVQIAGHDSPLRRTYSGNLN